MKENVTAMYARKNFGRLLDKTALLGDTYIIERSGRPMAALVSVDTLQETQADTMEMQKNLEKLIKKIKGSKSKKLEKAIADARESANKLLL